jgi:transposase
MLRTGAAWRDLPPDYGKRSENSDEKAAKTAKIACTPCPER